MLATVLAKYYGATFEEVSNTLFEVFIVRFPLKPCSYVDALEMVRELVAYDFLPTNVDWVGTEMTVSQLRCQRPRRKAA
jgi:hypothetical protein